MTESTETTFKTESKISPAAFEVPKFELPNFELPKVEIPTAFRDLAEKSVSQAKETYEKMKSAAEEATDVLEDTYATATKGVSDYGLKVIEAARANTNAAFDFASQLLTVKRPSKLLIEWIIQRGSRQLVLGSESRVFARPGRYRCRFVLTALVHYRRTLSILGSVATFVGATFAGGVLLLTIALIELGMPGVQYCF